MQKIPRPHHHRASGQARLRWRGKHLYFGRWKDPATFERYRSWLCAVLAVKGRHADEAPPSDSLVELAAAYLRFAATYYVKAGRPTRHYMLVRRSLERLLEWLGDLAYQPPATLGPARLAAWRNHLLATERENLTRKTMNDTVAVVKRMYRWAAERELVEADVALRLRVVATVRRGRSSASGLPPAREGRGRRSAPLTAVLRCRAHLPPAVRAMVRLQLVTGMRPSEVCSLRPADLAPSGAPGVVAYSLSPDVDKTAHLRDTGDRRVVYLGPRAMRIVRRWIDGIGESEYAFSPRRSETSRNAARRRGPKWPSHDPDARRARRIGERARRRPPGDRYTQDSYRRAIHRACERAGMPRERWWSPHQLRHNAATRIARAQSLDVARLMLGHTDVATTMIYVDPDRARAIAAAGKLG